MKLIHFFFKNKKNKSEKDNLVSQSSNISKNNNSTNSTTTGSSANICNNMNNNKLNKAPFGSVNNNDNTLLATNNSLTQKHAKLINKKADESLDSLSYFDETHIQKIKNELNSNIKQTQLIVSTGINNNNLNTKTSIANNDNNNYFNLNNNNEENITSSAFMNSNNGCNVINSNNYDTSNNNATTTTTTGGRSGSTTIMNNSNQINSGGNSSGSAGGGGGGGNRNRINNENTALCQSTRTNLRDSSSISNRKEKKTSVGYRLGKRKLLFEKRRQISDYALIFAMTGVFLMIVETEFSMSLLYSKVIFCFAGIVNEIN